MDAGWCVMMLTLYGSNHMVLSIHIVLFPAAVRRVKGKKTWRAVMLQNNGKMEKMAAEAVDMELQEKLCENCDAYYKV